MTSVLLFFHSNTPLEYVSNSQWQIALLINVIFTAITAQFYNKQLAKYVIGYLLVPLFIMTANEGIKMFIFKPIKVMMK